MTEPATDETEPVTPTATATEQTDSTSTPTESVAPSIAHEEIPVYPDASEFPMAAGGMGGDRRMPSPDSAEQSGYQSPADPATVASWYLDNMPAWTQEYDTTIELGMRFLTFTREDTGVVVQVMENRMGDSGSMFRLISMATSTLFPGAPRLGHPGVAIEPYDPDTGRAGGFDFDALQSGGEEPLRFFGGDLGGKVNPAYEYRTADDATVFASINGVVTMVEQNQNFDDYAIHIAPSEDSVTFVDQDHVLEPKVSEGDVVEAGDELGRTGIWETDGVGRTEVQVGHFFGPHYCPLTNVEKGRRDALEGKITQLVSDWEGASGTEYDHSFVQPGCLRETWVQSG